MFQSREGIETYPFPVGLRGPHRRNREKTQDGIETELLIRTALLFGFLGFVLFDSVVGYGGRWLDHR